MVRKRTTTVRLKITKPNRLLSQLLPIPNTMKNLEDNNSYRVLRNIFRVLKDRLQILLPILSEFQRINQLTFSLKLSENHRFSDDFMGNSS